MYILGAGAAGLARHEVYLDCPRARDLVELQFYGEKELSVYYEINSLDVLTLPKVFLLNRDYDLGDRVTVLVSRLGIRADLRVTQIREVWERQVGRQVGVRLGARLPAVGRVGR